MGFYGTQKVVYLNTTLSRGGGNTDVETAVQKRRPSAKPRIYFYLDSQHAAYIDHVVMRDEISQSSVVARVISDNAGVLPPSGSSQKEVRHLTIDPDHLAQLNCLVVALGMDRSEIMRRLIDKAMTEDPILRLA